MPPSARRDSLQLSLGDEDSDEEAEEWVEGQVDASWLSENQGLDSNGSGGVDVGPSTASTDTARHDTVDYGVDELEGEEDDLNLSHEEEKSRQQERAKNRRRSKGNGLV